MIKPSKGGLEQIIPSYITSTIVGIRQIPHTFFMRIMKSIFSVQMCTQMRMVFFVVFFAYMVATPLIPIA